MTFESMHPRNPSAANTGEFGAKPVTAPPAGLLRWPNEEETHLVPDGVSRILTTFSVRGTKETVSQFDLSGALTRKTSYEPSDVPGELDRTADEHFLGGLRHDLNDVTPAVTAYKNGSVSLILRNQHGILQDPVDGTPALRAFDVDGREQMRVHYAGGKMQDPAPEVPAHVATLASGITRSTFYTQDVATKQVDRFPTTTGGILDGDLVITRDAV